MLNCLVTVLAYNVFLTGKSTSDTSTLGDLGVVPNGTVQLELHSSDPVNHPIKLFRPRQEYHMPDVITVRIHIGLSDTVVDCCTIVNWMNTAIILCVHANII